MILITGGVRSGKSAFGEACARRLAAAAGAGPDGVVYVATSRVWDGEMADRVARHRAARPAGWQTVEAPLDLAGALAAPPAAVAPVVLVESVDAWVANRLMDADPIAGEQIDREALARLEASLLEDAAAIVRLEATGRARLVLVTLEAGWGVVPPSPLGRAFRDVLGRVNQSLAREAASVYLLVAGLPLDVARLSRETLSQIDAAGT
jgi:adenosylcobinamide kinase / adenosylcobinamide-phosphate guanylyltransferase